MAEVRLPGCAPEPLLGYLKALGVFRLVAEQSDADVRARWDGSAFVLEGKLDREGLLDFFLARYRPTPILAPWNGGSGFYGGGAEPLMLIEESSGDRLAPYREAIHVIRSFVPESKPKDAEKEHLLRCCRAELPDTVVPWLDTCFVLTEQGPGYFPLLGTGGNDGRLDFTNNFMQRLAEVIPFGADEPISEESRRWLMSALFADGLGTRLGKAAVGQFNPGGIGGANGVQGRFEADSRVNPWDFVLMLEGSLLFAGSVARRLGAESRDRPTFPFTVQSVAVGYGSAAANEETPDGSRAELWLPLWGAPAGLPEVSRLFAEGRAQWGRRQARNAVEFALAVCLFGVGRGIESFARYGFLRRNGLAFLAAPLGRVRVHDRPRARLLDDPALGSWLAALRRACQDKDKTPARYQAALRGTDRAIFDFANGAQTDEQANRKALRNVLVALGRAERTLAGGQRFCIEEDLSPLQGLKPDWLLLPEGDDPAEWREFRLAAALASLRGVKEVGPLRVHLEEVEVTRRVSWSPGSTSAVWGKRPLEANLSEVFLRRWLETERAGGQGVALKGRLGAQLADVVAFLNRETDDELMQDLLWALVGIDWARRDWLTEHRQDLRERFRPPPRPAPRDLALLRLVAEPVGLALTAEPGKPRRWQVVRHNAPASTTPTAAPFRLLGRAGEQGGDILDEAVEQAAHRLWADRLVPFGWENRRRRQLAYRACERVAPQRLLAACLFPLSPAALARLANRVLVVPAEVN